MKYEVVYYDKLNGRQLWWPADTRKEVAEQQLSEAWKAGKEDARMVTV